MRQIGAVHQDGVQRLQARTRSDEHAHAAIAQDVPDLIGLEQRIDGDEHGALRGRAERRDHRFDSLVEVHGNASAASHAQRCHRTREARDLRSQLRIVQSQTFVAQRARIRSAMRGCKGQFVQEGRFDRHRRTWLLGGSRLRYGVSALLRAAAGGCKGTAGIVPGHARSGVRQSARARRMHALACRPVNSTIAPSAPATVHAL